MDSDAPGRELVGNDLRRPRFLERGLGMTVKIAPNRDKLRPQCVESVGRDRFHTD
jgi:hypothetical protein